jgi:hypothetical protein
MALVAGACLAMTVGLLVAATQRSPLTLKTARHPALLPRAVAGARVVNFYSAFVVNRSQRPYKIILELGPSPLAVQWRGPSTSLQMAAGEHRRLDFGLETDIGQLATHRTVDVVLRDTAGTILATNTVTLTGPLDAKGAYQPQASGKKSLD